MQKCNSAEVFQRVTLTGSDVKKCSFVTSWNTELNIADPCHTQ